MAVSQVSFYWTSRNELPRASLLLKTLDHTLFEHGYLAALIEFSRGLNCFSYPPSRSSHDG